MGVNFKKAFRKEMESAMPTFEGSIILSYSFCAGHMTSGAGAVWSKLGKNGFLTNFMTKKMSMSDKSQDDSWWQL